MLDKWGKTKSQWEEEADTFLLNWKNAMSRYPTKNEVIQECIEFNEPPYNTQEYGETLWKYMQAYL